MKNNRRALCVVIVLAIIATTFWPAATTYAYPTTYSFNVPQKVQEKSKWCWAACGVSIIEYIKSQYVMQSWFATTVNGTDANAGASTSGICYGFSMYCVNSTAIEDKLLYSTVVNKTYNNKPIMCGRVRYERDEYGYWHRISGHFMIACGYDSSDSQQIVRLMDPGYINYQYRSYSSLSSLTNGDVKHIWETTIYQFS